MSDEMTCYACGAPLPPTTTARVCLNCGALLLLHRGTRFYRINNIIARGGFGLVYDATEGPSLNRRCAIKRIEESPPALTSQIIKNEVHLLSIHGPRLGFIPDVYDHWSTGRSHFIVMQYIEGETLDKRYGNRTWPVSRAMECLGALLQQLATLHAAGIIHRDIKPNNIKYNERRQYMLLDFGLASNAGGTLINARTPAYAPPEQLDDRPVHLRTDQRSDLYSLAATIYYLLTGRPPRRPESQAREQVALDFPARVPAAMGDLLSRMLAAAPDNRPPSAYACLEIFRTIPPTEDDPAEELPDAPDAPTVPDKHLDATDSVSASTPMPTTLQPRSYTSHSPMRLYGRINDLSISPDGSEIAVATSIGLVRYRLADGGELSFTARNAPVQHALYTAADHSILIAEPKRLQIIDADSRPSQRSMRWANPSPTRRIAVAARGNKLIEFSERTVVLQTVAPQGYLEDFPGASVAAITPEGDRLALASDTQVSIYVPGDRTQLLNLPTTAEPVVDLAFSDTGRLLAIATATSVALWDLSSRQRTTTARSTVGPIRAIALTSNGATLAIAGQAGVTIAPTGSAETRWIAAEGAPEHIFRIAFSADGQTLVGCSYEGIWAWNTDSGKLRYAHRSPSPYLDSVQCLAIASDGKKLASLGSQLILWAVHSDDTISPIRDLGRFPRTKNGMAFDPTGRFLAIATGSGVWLCDIAAGMRVDPVLPADSIDQAHGVMFANVGATLLTVGREGVFQHEVNHFLRTDKPHPSEHITPEMLAADSYGVAIAPDGKMLAAYNDSAVEVLDMRGERVCHITTNHVNDVALNADQQLLVVATSDRVETWRIAATPQRIDTKPGGGQLVVCAPDGQQIALLELTNGSSLNRQSAILVYRLVDGTLAESHLLAMHNEEVTDVAFVPGQQALFSTSRDGTIRLWRYG